MVAGPGRWENVRSLFSHVSAFHVCEIYKFDQLSLDPNPETLVVVQRCLFPTQPPFSPQPSLCHDAATTPAHCEPRAGAGPSVGGPIPEGLTSQDARCETVQKGYEGECASRLHTLRPSPMLILGYSANKHRSVRSTMVWGMSLSTCSVPQV